MCRSMKQVFFLPMLQFPNLNHRFFFCRCSVDLQFIVFTEKGIKKLELKLLGIFYFSRKIKSIVKRRFDASSVILILRNENDFLTLKCQSCYSQVEFEMVAFQYGGLKILLILLVECFNSFPEGVL